MAHNSLRKRYLKVVQRQRGIAYLSLLLLVALMAIASLAAVTVTSMIERRHAEEELLFIGSQFQSALISYANSTPPGMSRNPRNLGDLLIDRRSSLPRRHLRKIYVDPMTKTSDWGLVFAADGSIIGVHSNSVLQPIKVDFFPTHFAHFKSVGQYRDWIFSGTLR